MSLACPIGPEGNLLEPDERTCHRLWLDHPILSLQDMVVLKNTKIMGWRTKVIDITYDPDESMDLQDQLDRVCAEAEKAAEDHQFLVLSDRAVGPRRVPISALLAAGAVHHHLINARLRSKCAIVLETGEIREVHQVGRTNLARLVTTCR